MIPMFKLPCVLERLKANSNPILLYLFVLPAVFPLINLDICGFTAWSSMHEPTEVFMLLEHIYSTFDSIAKRRRVFKVETIGDCYVAACGLPVPRQDHALVMAKFSNECLNSVGKVMNGLEAILGPGM